MLMVFQAVALTTMPIGLPEPGYPGGRQPRYSGATSIPFISGEEPKIAAEPMKLLGRLGSDQTVTEARFPIDATSNTGADHRRAPAVRKNQI